MQLFFYLEIDELPDIIIFEDESAVIVDENINRPAILCYDDNPLKVHPDIIDILYIFNDLQLLRKEGRVEWKIAQWKSEHETGDIVDYIANMSTLISVCYFDEQKEVILNALYPYNILPKSTPGQGEALVQRKLTPQAVGC